MLCGSGAGIFLCPHRLECGGEACGLCWMIEECRLAEVVAETLTEEGAQRQVVGQLHS